MPIDLCHVNAGPFCKNKMMANMSTEYVKAYIAYMELNSPSLWIDTDCVKEFLYPDYMEARKIMPHPTEESSKLNLYLLLGIAIGSLVAVFILLLVIYIKRKAINESDTREEIEGLT
jgi:hypothetical protein